MIKKIKIKRKRPKRRKKPVKTPTLPSKGILPAHIIPKIKPTIPQVRL